MNLTDKLSNFNFENFFLPSSSSSSSSSQSQSRLSYGTTKFLAPEAIYSPFNPQSMIENISAIPLAYGDFDSDKFTDIFMLGNNGTSIYLLKGHSCVDGKTVLTFFGSRRCLSIVHDFHCHLSNNVYNLIASDFTGHMHQDLLITVKSTKFKSRYDIILVNGNTTAEEFNCNERKKILINNAKSEPFILDYNGDMISDFIVETDDCSLQLVLGGVTDTTIDTIDHYNNLTIDSNHEPKNRYVCLSNLTKIKHLAHPHASGFLNLNSYLIDMTSDLFINGQNEFEYIYNIPQEGFQPNQNGENLYSFPTIASIRGQSSFVDLNYDGKLEHLIPVCLDSDAKSFAQCKQPNLMVFDMDTGDWFSILNTTEPLGTEFNRTLTFIDSRFCDYIEIPVTLHIGDIDYDGYPDFATILFDQQTEQTVAAIFLNKMIDGEKNTWNRIFQLDWIGEYTENVRMVSLFDIFNNGRLNLLITTENAHTNQLTLQSYDYYGEKSLYFSFLRVNVISGLCSDKTEDHKCPNHLAYGGTPPGAMVCFAGPYTDDHCCSVQMSQTAHFALQPPYIIFGLGDVLNVINDLSISIANGKNPSRTRKWNEIIPGSNLVIVPYEPDQMKNWELRVFINMSIYSLVSLSFLLILGLILTCAISILHFREKVEDRIDNQQYRNAWL
nr:T-cell immunomodulatory protein-like [Dermatophagoides farinae]